ncbi:MAG TPA: FCD domain-containing protein, partial [Actinomycetaceae bacterium]|nr:FCD domain-containing protein [Actinomycetaceae bacterium]
QRTEDDILAMKKALTTPVSRHHCPAHATGGSDTDLAARFHYLVFDAAKNRLLASLYSGITEKLNLPENQRRLTHAADAAQMQEEHERIADAIARGDFIDAVHAMADHVDNDLMITSSSGGLIPPLRRSDADAERIAAVREDEERRATG